MNRFWLPTVNQGFGNPQIVYMKRLGVVSLWTKNTLEKLIPYGQGDKSREHVEVHRKRRCSVASIPILRGSCFQKLPILEGIKKCKPFGFLLEGICPFKKCMEVLGVLLCHDFHDPSCKRCKRKRNKRYVSSNLNSGLEWMMAVIFHSRCRRLEGLLHLPFLERIRW